MMDGFKLFLEVSEEIEKNVRDTLKKVPKSHAALIRGFRYRWEAGNTLKGDDEHVGLIDSDRKQVRIAAPWNYGREFTFLHELAHKVYEKFMTDELRAKWKSIVKKTKHKSQQNAEELFCMAYSDYYAKNKIQIHHHPEWERFIKTEVPH